MACKKRVSLLTSDIAPPTRISRFYLKKQISPKIQVTIQPAKILELMERETLPFHLAHFCKNGRGREGVEFGAP
jgi:hypothetical protein